MLTQLLYLFLAKHKQIGKIIIDIISEKDAN